MLTNRNVLRYLWQIRKQIPGKWRKKKRILSRVAVSIRDFASSNPRADYDAIVARFGTPHQIAASCLEDMDTDELLDDLRIKRKIVGIVATIAMAVFLLWFGAVTYATVESSIAANGFAVVEVNEVYDDITNREISK